MQLNYKPITEADLEWARVLHNDPEVLQMLTDTHEVQPDEQIRWFESLSRSKSSRRLVVWQGQMRAGLVRIDQLDYENSSVCIGLDIDPAFRGQGYARVIYKDMFEMFFVDEGINRIWLLVAEFNSRARHIYTSLGFKEEGRHRQGLTRFGKKWDYILMGILKEEYHG